MYCKFALATLALLVGNEFASANQIPSTTTAAELWNPWTWFWPYAIATAEAYRDYYEKAQKATNELYQQVYNTNAFPWITGNWGAPQVPGGSGQGGSAQQNQTSGSGQGGSPQQNQTEQGGSTPGTTTQPPSAGNTTPPDNSTTDSNNTQVQGNLQSNTTVDAEVNAN